jgi:hypothetical protein
VVVVMVVVLRHGRSHVCRARIDVTVGITEEFRTAYAQLHEPAAAGMFTADDADPDRRQRRHLDARGNDSKSSAW